MIMIAMLLLAEPIEYKVEVDGKSFRIEVRGDEVEVYPKGIFAAQTPKQRSRMKQAVTDATGCDIGDPYWEETRLVGEFVCPEGVEPTPPPGRQTKK